MHPGTRRNVMRRWATTVSIAVLTLLVAAVRPARADIKLHGLCSSGMVLQRGQKVPIWGTGAPHDRAEIQFQGKTFKTKDKGDKSGKWTVWLDDLKVGGPFEMT